MRLFVNFLAVVILLVGAAAVLGNLAIMVGTMIHADFLRNRLSADSPVFVIMLMSACVCTLAAFMAYRAMMHLRNPDADTMRDVVTLAIYWIALVSFSPLIRHQPSAAFLTIIALGLLRRYLVRRLTPKFASIH